MVCAEEIRRRAAKAAANTAKAAKAKAANKAFGAATNGHKHKHANAATRAIEGARYSKPPAWHKWHKCTRGSIGGSRSRAENMLAAGQKQWAALEQFNRSEQQFKQSEQSEQSEQESREWVRMPVLVPKTKTKPKKTKANNKEANKEANKANNKEANKASYKTKTIANPWEQRPCFTFFDLQNSNKKNKK